MRTGLRSRLSLLQQGKIARTKESFTGFMELFCKAVLAN